jgi:hypothetical protein
VSMHTREQSFAGGGGTIERDVRVALLHCRTPEVCDLL